MLTASEADRKDAMKQGNAVFAFTLKNAAGETESWHIDLKNKGEVGKGLGEKPNGTRILFVFHQTTGHLFLFLFFADGEPVAQSPLPFPTPTLAPSSPARPTPSGYSCRASSRSREMS